MSKVFVGLSGGVDSSVAAALLVEQGHDVVGVYMKNWSKDVAGHHCPWKEDLASARTVAAHLDIPLKVYDFEKQYFKSVTKYMLEAYKKGITPNPDIMCNQEIKFKVFLEQCLAEGAEKIATGHYARLHEGTLLKARDDSKDQTYFLYRMNPNIADKVLFPIGDLLKSRVREVAKEKNLPTASRPDSQGLCFVGNVDMKDFLAEFIKPQKGEVVDDTGKVLGSHMGAYAYTVGQRHGLGIGGGKPYFVYRVNTKLNKVFVTTDEDSELLNKKEFNIADCVWWDDPMKHSRLTVKVRYRSFATGCEVKKVNNNKFAVTLNKKERAVTPGQSAVFYDGDEVVGGGIIL
jgi:tRNA-uridine 2-sulfurtransferase